MSGRRKFLVTTVMIVLVVFVAAQFFEAEARRRRRAPAKPAGRKAINYSVTIYNKTFRKIKLEIFGEWLLKYPDKNNFEKLPNVRKTYNTVAPGATIKYSYKQGYYEGGMTKFYISYLYLDQPQRGWIDLQDCYHTGSKVLKANTCTCR